jgi:hypothetical protein
MKITFETEDENEAKTILKANDMACFIFELKNNLWRQFKHIDYEYEPYKKAVIELLDEFGLLDENIGG